MSKQPDNKPNIIPPAIYITRVDGVTFQLNEIRDGKVIVLMREAFPFIEGKAHEIIQKMAEEAYK